MVTGELLQAAGPLIIAGVTVPAVLGGYKWLRAVSGAVGKLTEVSEQLGQHAETMGELGRLMRATRRELAAHVRDCTHQAAADRAAAFAGPDRRRVPHPRALENGARP